MPRERSPCREKAKEMYLNSKGQMKLKDIASELGVLDTQIRKWKSTDKWDDELKGTLPKNKKEQLKSNVTKKNVLKPEEVNPGEKYLEVDELTVRQRLFAEIYVRTPIAYKAAIKAGYSPDSAYVESSRLLRNPKVKAYIDYLKELKRQSLFLDIEDLVDLNMRIAFADIKDYTEFGQERVPVMSNGLPVMFDNPTTGKKDILTQRVNTVKLKESFEVDGELISEIKTSRQGVSIKLEDRRKAIQWLTDYFEFNPEHRYRKEFDDKKLHLERERFEHQKKMDELNNF